MLNLVIVLFSAALILLCGFLALVILMQKSTGNAGMGSALGGGAAESAFGGQTSSVLSKATIYGIATFFILVFCLYLAHMALATESNDDLSVFGSEGLSKKEATLEASEAENASDNLTAEAIEQVEAASQEVAETLTTVQEEAVEQPVLEEETDTVSPEDAQDAADKANTPGGN